MLYKTVALMDANGKLLIISTEMSMFEHIVSYRDNMYLEHICTMEYRCDNAVQISILHGVSNKVEFVKRLRKETVRKDNYHGLSVVFIEDLLDELAD